MLSLAASIGYDSNLIKHLRFCPPGVSLDEGLKLLFDDDSVVLLCKYLEEDEKLVNAYVEHGDSAITGEVPLPAGFNEPIEVVAGFGDEHGGSGGEMNDTDHSSSEEEEARVLEQNEEEEEEIALVNLDLDSDGGEDPEVVSALNKVKKAIEKEQQRRKGLEELEFSELHEIPMQQRQKKKVHASGPGGPSGGRPSGGPSVSFELNSSAAAHKDGEESPYFDSNQPHNCIKTNFEDSEVDDAQRCISRGLQFRPDGFVPAFFEDQIFTGPAQFKEALREYRLGKHKAFYDKKNDNQRVRAKCFANGCEWEILVSYHWG
ncbi:Transposase, MuDR, plant [Corchorus olitorius]|uniref:Transposase, MuDR, plant n=1 Tax=Corchorus olitorius TaxID=93759 RepID=A0A1R3JTV8_9ROSI|nr:Transposase, MuDR, plant [Corchorus olitorius]